MVQLNGGLDHTQPCPRTPHRSAFARPIAANRCRSMWLISRVILIHSEYHTSLPNQRPPVLVLLDRLDPHEALCFPAGWVMHVLREIAITSDEEAYRLGSVGKQHIDSDLVG